MKKLHFGRSMIEMLGVLAIVGVLSIGGMSMYRKAILNYRLGQMQHWIENVRFIVAEACGNDNKYGCSQTETYIDRNNLERFICSQGNQFICSSGKLRSPLEESTILVHMNDSESLYIYLIVPDKRTCQAIIDYDWNGLMSLQNYTNWTPRESVMEGNKHFTEEQKERLKAACPYPAYIVLRFNLKS